ncbi:hypothetical protein SAMN04488018_1069 [Myroides marinus]|uniref:Uncharacterized protein n=1 Tax=Myroides marinus TaxID=703342 RepID=A0A1H6U2V5_9FLAO|nr:hypothetical protein [Myroides marinus]KUF42386.1 hypothetical protein AS361_00770 [Myroides marinus]SEI86688.1 hypothetical protein SAMN04488018_1069 [Myroides marinus]
MSYTKLTKDIEKYYKQHGMFYYYNALETTVEEQQQNLITHNEVRDIIITQWQEDKRYKELISCAHGGWYSYEEFNEPLALYFVKQNEVLALKVLCERGIRFTVEDMLKVLVRAEEEFSTITKEEMIKFNLDLYLESKVYHPVGEVIKYRAKALYLIDHLIRYIKEVNELEYLEQLEILRSKVYLLEVKKSDLKYFKHRLL